MPKKDRDPKVKALRESHTLNPRAARVKDEQFRGQDFFDSRDLVQVKYEMVRRVQVDGCPVSQSAAAFGLSRPSFYQAQEAFQARGVAGLIPQKRGPREAHKLSREVLDVVDEARLSDASVGTADLAKAIKDRFGVTVHPRSVERALKRREKKRR
jgi:transposase